MCGCAYVVGRLAFPSCSGVCPYPGFTPLSKRSLELIVPLLTCLFVLLNFGIRYAYHRYRASNGAGGAAKGRMDPPQSRSARLREVLMRTWVW